MKRLTTSFLASIIAASGAAAQEYVAEDPAAFEAQLMRMGACTNFVIQRDPGQIPVEALEAVGDQPALGEPLGETLDEEFGRAFLQRPDPSQGLERTVGFWAADRGRSRTVVGCHLERFNLTDADMAALGRSAVEALSANFPVIQAYEEGRRADTMVFCISTGRPLQLLIRHREGSLTGITFQDGVGTLNSTRGAITCDYEEAS